MKKLLQNGQERCVMLMFIAVLSCVLTPPVAVGQSLAVQAGTSTLMDSSGGEVQYRWKGVGGFFSLGYQEQLDFGAYAGYRYRGLNVGGGDRTVDFELGTDNLGTSRFFYGRGFFIDRNGEHDSLKAFGGVTTNRFGSFFYDAARGVDATGALFYKRQDGDKLTFYSANIFQDRITTLQSISYRATDRVTLATTAGLGANTGYSAWTFDYSQRHFDLSAGYILAGESFEAVPGVRLLGSERIGANAKAHIKLTETFNVTAEHGKMRTLPDDSQRSNPREAVLDSVSSTLQWRDTLFTGMASTSESGSLWTHTYVGSATRKLFSETVTASGMFLRQAVAGRDATNSIILNGEERIGPQLTITEGYTRNGSSNTFSAGARFVSNRLIFGVGQQLYYSPLAGQNKVASIWTFNANLRVYGSVRLHADTYVTENGQVRHTFWVDGLRFQRGGDEALPDAGRQYANVKFGKFMVRGLVVDEAGQPVWGMAIGVDGKMAYSDNAGAFILRFSEGQTFPVTVMVEQSLTPTMYEVVQAPVSVRAETQDSAQIMSIVVRRAKIQPTPTPAPKGRSATEVDDETRPGGNALQSFAIPGPLGLLGSNHSSACFPQ